MSDYERDFQARTNYLHTLRNLAARRLEIDSQVRQLVLAGRQVHATWYELGDALGVSPQAVHAKYAERSEKTILPGQDALPIGD